MNIKIERQMKNPILEKGKNRIYPFHDLKMGDAFHIELNVLDKVECRRVYMNVVNSSRNFQKKVTGSKFFVYKTPTGLTCYRMT